MVSKGVPPLSLTSPAECRLLLAARPLAPGSEGCSPHARSSRSSPALAAAAEAAGVATGEAGAVAIESTVSPFTKTLSKIVNREKEKK